MRTFNTPAQARSLREIEAAAMSPVTETTKDVNGTVQPVQPAETKATEEAGEKAQTEGAPKKARSKKNAEAV